MARRWYINYYNSSHRADQNPLNFQTQQWRENQLSELEDMIGSPDDEAEYDMTHWHTTGLRL